jgi:hypothetical protein
MKQKSKDISMKLANDVVKNHAPLLFHNKLGEYIDFRQVSECYLHVMMVALKNAPRGYVETKLLLKELYPNSYAVTITAMYDVLKPLGVPLYDLFEFDDKDAEKYFHNLVKGLCIYNNVDFNEKAFASAWQQFSYRYQVEKEIRNKKAKDGNS